NTYKVNHTVEIDIVKLVVEIKSFGVSANELDKETGSSNRFQPKQANLSCVHALNEPHLHETHVVPTIQADCDVKPTNIILQGLPPEVYALVSNYKVTKELWERIQLLMQGTSLTKQERECVKLVQDFHTTNIGKLHAYLVQHEFHANKYGSPYQSQQYSRNQSSTPLSITHPSNDYQSSVYHNAYSPPSSIPQIAYAPTVNQQQQQLEFPSLD
nr:hypothetical protein [Tanacetum cinerariifolium]